MKKTLILIPLLCIGFCLSAQNLYVLSVNGDQDTFSLAERPAITFDNRAMVIQGEIFQLNEIQILSFVPNATPPSSSIETVLANEQIAVFPNPVTDQLHIVIPREARNLLANSVARLLDINGRKLIEQPLSQETTINMQNFRSGIYILHILRNGQTVQSFQVVKQ